MRNGESENPTFLARGSARKIARTPSTLSAYAEGLESDLPDARTFEAYFEVSDVGVLDTPGLSTYEWLDAHGHTIAASSIDLGIE